MRQSWVHPATPRPARSVTPQSYSRSRQRRPIGIFSQSEIAETCGYFDDLLAGALDAGWSGYEVTNWHKHCGGVWDIVPDRRITNVVADLLAKP